MLNKFACHGSKFSKLLHLVGPTLSRQTRRSYPLSAEVQLLSALRFYAVGSFLEVVCFEYGLRKTSVWWCVHSVTNILLHHATVYICMALTRHKLMETHQGFHAIVGVLRLNDLVDGTLVPIATPSALNQAFIIHRNMII